MLKSQETGLLKARRKAWQLKSERWGALRDSLVPPVFSSMTNTVGKDISVDWIWILKITQN